MKRQISIVIVSIFFLASCGTVVNSTRQELVLNSEPQGVTARVGTQECKTPCILTVPRKSEKIVLEKDGKEKTFELEKKFNGWSVILGNILWLLPGIAVDVITGGAYTVESANLNLENAKIAMQSRAIPEQGQEGQGNQNKQGSNELSAAQAAKE